MTKYEYQNKDFAGEITEMCSKIRVEWIAAHFGIGLTENDPLLTKICTKNDIYLLLPPKSMKSRKIIRKSNLQPFRSSILLSIESALCDFLVVINSNSNSCRFRDIDAFNSKMACFLHPPLLDASVRGSPLEFQDETFAANTRGMGRVVKISCPNFNRLLLIHPCDGQTDRQRTDRVTDGR